MLRIPSRCGKRTGAEGPSGSGVESDSDADVSRDAQSLDALPSLGLVDTCYMMAWIPKNTLQLVDGATLLRGYFANEEGQNVLTYVPTQATWQLVHSKQVKRVLKAANIW